MLVVTIKSPNGNKFNDQQLCVEGTIKKVAVSLEKQNEHGEIVGVAVFNRMIKREVYGCIENQMHDPRVIGRNSKKTQISKLLLS